MKFNNLMHSSIEASLKAGVEILKIYEKNFDINYKEDNSPVTEADLISNEIIKQTLSKYNLPFLSEESKKESFDVRKRWKNFWMIDPIDGTKEFIKKNGEFTINIALINRNKPILGVVYAPVTGELYFASQLHGAKKVNVIDIEFNYINDISVLINDAKKIPFTKMHKHYSIVTGRCALNDATKDFIKKIQSRYKNVKIIKLGSSIKICKVAEGYIQVYPRFHQTKEWDTAAAHAILKYSGGNILNLNSEELIYNKKEIRNPDFIAQLID